MKEIKITKTYKSDIINGICECCSNCIKYIGEDGQNFYCLIDDKYKYPEDENFKCPWLIKDKNEKLNTIEENCFATKEEAQKECDRRNGQK